MEIRLAVGLGSLLAAAQTVQLLALLWRSLPSGLLLLVILLAMVVGAIAWGEWVRWLNHQPSEYRTFAFDRHLPVALALVGFALGFWSIAL